MAVEEYRVTVEYTLGKPTKTFRLRAKSRAEAEAMALKWANDDIPPVIKTPKILRTHVSGVSIVPEKERR